MMKANFRPRRFSRPGIVMKGIGEARQLPPLNKRPKNDTATTKGYSVFLFCTYLVLLPSIYTLHSLPEHTISPSANMRPGVLCTCRRARDGLSGGFGCLGLEMEGRMRERNGRGEEERGVRGRNTTLV
ncbi:hypothetical protein E2C01_024193 [Portunus trituberculatus]|uniref:Uncharacterized protein n=1 Tax=Portunus trituberculatus TaxID=210409 RepID=A0A5B7E9W9_PORTR|nr:hypothetical protein [Portunus trituberculatus]